MGFMILLMSKGRQLAIPVALSMHPRLRYASCKQVEEPWQICWLHTYAHMQFIQSRLANHGA